MFLLIVLDFPRGFDLKLRARDFGCGLGFIVYSLTTTNLNHYNPFHPPSTFLQFVSSALMNNQPVLNRLRCSPPYTRGRSRAWPPTASPGPGSLLNTSAPTGATRFNYHTAFVKSFSFKTGILYLEVLPAPSFSHPDEFGDSSATWFLKQDLYFRDRHLPLLYYHFAQPDPPQPPTPTPQAFGIPLNLDGWLGRRPSSLDIDGMALEIIVDQCSQRSRAPAALR